MLDVFGNAFDKTLKDESDAEEGPQEVGKDASVPGKIVGNQKYTKSCGLTGASKYLIYLFQMHKMRI